MRRRTTLLGPLAWALLALGAPGAGAQSYHAELGAPSDTDQLIPLHAPPGETSATTHLVHAGESIQDAIAAASDGDLIRVGPGTFVGDLDFLGKALRIVGDRTGTVLRGTGSGPVVRFRSGEGSDSILESLTLTGGNAPLGGGVHIDGASPTLVRTIITENRASSAGSGIWIQGPAAPRIYNNLLVYNANASGDPHTIQIQDADPLIVNNTIARGDSNGILARGASDALVMNNVIALNGSRGRGRGICDFSDDGLSIRHNVFFRNRIAALLYLGADWRSIERFQERNPAAAKVTGNLDGRPGFFRRPRRRPDRVAPSDFRPVALGRPAAAIAAGDPDPACNDLGGGRNTAGYSGGPFAPGSTRLPGPGDCGLP